MEQSPHRSARTPVRNKTTTIDVLVWFHRRCQAGLSGIYILDSLDRFWHILARKRDLSHEQIHHFHLRTVRYVSRSGDGADLFGGAALAERRPLPCLWHGQPDYGAGWWLLPLQP